MGKDLSYEETQELLHAPWRSGTLTRDFHYEGLHPAGEKVLWKVYHNDTDYISVRLYDSSGDTVIVEFTEVPELVEDTPDPFVAYNDAARHFEALTDREFHTLRNLMIATELDTVQRVSDWWDRERADKYYMEEYLCEKEQALTLWRNLKDLENAPYNLGRDHITNMAMKQSLCPVHFVDWAICFDDQPEDCSQIRAIFPNSHDT